MSGSQDQGGTAAAGQDPQQLLESMKRCAAALGREDIPFALAGGAAAYARGAGPPTHDIDFVLCEADVEAAAKALAEQGMRIAHPPEGWLVKAYDGETMIDLIFRIAGEPVGADLLQRAEPREVAAVRIPVLSGTDLVLSWLRSFSEHHADFAGALTSVRPLREQVSWQAVRAQTQGSPFAEAFLFLLERLSVIPGGQGPDNA